MTTKIRYIVLRDPETGEETAYDLYPEFYVRPYKPRSKQ